MPCATTNDLASEPIAIVGLSCKLAAEASSPQKLWEMIAAGRSGWSEIPPSRFNLQGAYHPKTDKLSTVNVRGGHFLEQDIGLFDAPFFSFSAEAASTLDPQFRLQLETVYEALENAGITLPEVAGSNTAVYAAMFVRDYRDNMIRDEDDLPRFLPTGTGDAMSSNRVSHFYDLRGPSFTLDTGCSGGLVAFHQGVQSLRTGESDMSLICGSNLFLNPDMFKAMGSVGLLSPDGKSYAFDSRANGFGRGEGVATLVIKRLSDAIAAGDPIRAVVRESGLNQDGKTDTITTPSEEAQVALMRHCYQRAGLDPRDTQYFEAHGTGTATGDPIECRAIATVFKDTRSVDDPLRIGSVKTNIGHTESVSGLASLIKVVLALERGQIPPSINFEKPNPNLALEDWRLRVVRELEEWPAGPGGVRRASINNFGYGGTNAHVIVENAEPWRRASLVNGHTEAETPLDSQLLVFSARDEQAGRRTISNLKEYLEARVSSEDPESLLQSIAYTLGQRRTRFQWVSAYHVPARKGLQETIAALESPKFNPRRTNKVPRVGFVFTGQGAQWYAMGRELIAAYPVYEASLKEADEYVKAFGADWSVIEELSREEESSRINQVELSTPLCVAVQISLVRLLESWGIKPVAVTSHSSGEIAAAYAVGALSYRSAMAVAYHRAVLAGDKSLRGPTKGAMIAVGMGLDETENYLTRLTADNGEVAVACVNSPSSITVSGDENAVIELEALAKEEGIFARRLKVETAFHSHHMSPIADPYRDALQGLSSTANEDEEDQVAFSSPVTGGRVGVLSQLADPDHWVDSLLQPVQFVDAFTDMVLGDLDASGTSIDAIIEVGPHTALGGPIKQILGLPEFADLKIPYFGTLVRNTSALESMQALAASLLTEGSVVDLDAVNFPRGRRPATVRVLSDLPSYPWSNQTRHWFESRFNKALREREQPPHNLLGALVLGTNLNSPTWRQIVKPKDAPWLREHVVQGNILYPGAGFMCLAIEAIKQLSVIQGKTQKISGYRLRNVDILQALVVPERDEGIEIQTALRPVNEKEIGSRGWSEFEVSSITADNQWTIHARGIITTELEDAPDKTVPKPRPAGLIGYTRLFEPKDLYKTLRSTGINHGKIFQAITDIEQAGNNSRADSKLFVPDTAMAVDLPYQPIVHPTTLDAVIQTLYAPLLGANDDEDGKVPRSVGSLWISSSISNAPGHVFKAFTTLRHADAQTLRADITVADDEDTTALPILEITNAVCQSLGRSASGESSDNQWEKEPCMKQEWAADLSIASVAALAQLKEKLSHEDDPKEIALLLNLRRVCLYFISDALAALSPAEIEQLPSHFAKFHTWMQLQTTLAAEGKLAADSASWLEDTPEQRRALIEEVRNASINGETVCHLGPQLAAILRGEVAVLELLQENNLLLRYYRGSLKGDRCSEQAAEVLQALVHKNPRARILEIGAGTGALTNKALRKLGTSEDGNPLAELYHYTDISHVFFQAAKEEFAGWSDLLAFDTLDIEADPAGQGFDLGSYDIVVAAQVLYATKSMATTMSNVRQLMKPGATLVLVETTHDQVDLAYVFGLLPGWWHSEEPQRALTPSLTVDFWDETLKATGFSGVDFEVRDCQSDDMYMVSLMTSTAGPVPKPSLQDADPIVLVTRRDAPAEQTWLEALQANLEKAAQLSEVVEFETAPPSAYAGKVVLFVGEIDQPLLHTLDFTGLTGVQTMVMHSKGLLWVTRGGAVESSRPELALATGFLRTMRHEYVDRKFVTLDLDPADQLWSDKSVSAIIQVLTSSFGTSEGAALPPPYELEYAERQGVLLVPRFFRDGARNRALNPKSVDWAAPNAIPKEPLFQKDRPLVPKVGVPGLLDTLAFEDDPDAPTEGKRFPPDMIEIEPRAYGVNFRDVMVAMGQLEERVMGLDCSGVITRVGSRAAAHGYAVGDEVFSLLRGGYGSRARVEWTSAMHIPAGLSFEDAASLPVLFCTVYLAFYKVARLQRGQTVLIHAGAGGVGQTAIQFAKLIGAEIYTTVGSPEKRALVMEQYGIPADRIFSSRDTSFAAGILAATNGRGVDVVLNSLAGPLLQESLNVVATFGHFVEIGKRDLEQNSYLEMRPFSRHISFSSFDLLTLAKHQKALVHSAMAEVGRLIEEGALKPVHPVTTYALSDISRAFRLLQAGKHTGKVVLSVSPQEQVPVLHRTQSTRLRSDASYLIVGGAGGLGRSIAHWLVAHGARNLVILSRSAGTNPAAAALVAELKPLGCRVKPISCDVSDAANLARAMEVSSTEVPPIRGVIQAAMVLQDTLIERMSLDDWNAATKSKIKGSWNLHTHFNTADSLDFFVFFSSMSGIYGNATQSNYGAGNTYEDALAHWRVSQGLPAVALNLGPVKAVGYVAENTGITARMTKMGHFPVTEDQVLGVLESAILSPFDRQVVVGMNQGAGPHWDVDGESLLGRDARFQAMRYKQRSQAARDGAGGSGAGGAATLASQLAVVTTKQEAQTLVGEAIAHKLSDIFMIPATDIDASKHPSAYGVDSLVAVELRNMLALQAAADVSIFNIMQSASLAALALEVAMKSTHIDASLFRS
ncbi:uncharacterized protein BJX67DRAFT_296391 [Aspergillus lucknowensis]|uniref:Polyketide synthase n=1 Tax=Aspergillus lucknowensis TaxID=176173 RepID=A0ABR4LDE5_9EURO